MRTSGFSRKSGPPVNPTFCPHYLITRMRRFLVGIRVFTLCDGRVMRAIARIVRGTGVTVGSRLVLRRFGALRQLGDRPPEAELIELAVDAVDHRRRAVVHHRGDYGRVDVLP